MSSSDDHRDPTAPPPLPEPTDQGTTDPWSTDAAPGADDTRAVGPEATQPFTPPAPPAPPAADPPHYSTPSYDLPAYDAAQDAPAPPAPSASDPYGAGPFPSAPPTPPANPYGSPAPAAYPPPPGAGYPPAPGAPSPYGIDPAWAPGAPGSPYAAPRNNTSALVLTIVSGLTTVITIAFCVGIVFIPALVFGIVGLTKQSSDPESSRRMARWGWISFGVAIGLGVLALVGIIVLAGTNGAFTGT
ncbi:hypothetical protein [Arthrobacter sp. NEB 688]|uniref:hypothetical protein n=1 Tax=Arthrobacter sp. NEB 688 TaxID=904039 RepID=UPI001564E13F|nr:hypothetical protein [Arthrobacter sp. NEB 688]QKE82580.1 hypothetical protein HL663_00485 [Arthrobacter sp. NEB 688]